MQSATATDGGHEGVNAMTRTDLTRTVTALFCTVVMSAACVLGAVAPAHDVTLSSPATHQTA